MNRCPGEQGLIASHAAAKRRLESTNAQKRKRQTMPILFAFLRVR
jgi:hypothetical protein